MAAFTYATNERLRDRHWPRRKVSPISDKSTLPCWINNLNGDLRTPALKARGRRLKGLGPNLLKR